ncbi:hypothetical protein Ahy_B01g052364 [Arachis hypogaea]|uniref:Uncharacterized protein n=1 Tax=Arachis hypogaea TaxID=3818 RepID=A0A445APB9_ARAHY|nr:hypothetical protein Ahy_B01g052364 [Arachis hypogaea]
MKDNQYNIEGATNRENDSRFDLLSEEDNENQHDSNVHEGVMSNMHGGLRINVSSQSNKGVQQSIQIIKKVPRPDAGKNAQAVETLQEKPLDVIMKEQPEDSIDDIKREFGISFLILLETHVSGDHDVKIRDMLDFDNCLVEEARGHSGGIWCLWDSSLW